MDKAEKLYQAVKSGQIKLEDLNENGKQTLRQYMGMETTSKTTAKKTQNVQPKSNVNPEFAEKHPTITKILDVVSTPLQKLFGNQNVQRMAEKSADEFLLTNREQQGGEYTPATSKTAQTITDIGGAVVGSLPAFSKLYKGLDVAATKLPTIAQKVNPLVKTGVKGAVAGGAYEGAVGVGHDLEPEEIAKRALIGAVTGAAGDMAITKLPEIVRAVRQGEMFGTPQGALQSLDLRSPVNAFKASTPPPRATRSGGVGETIPAPPEINPMPFMKDVGLPSDKAPIEMLTFDEVGGRSVKSISAENPELVPHIRMEANRLLGELKDTVKGKRTYAEYDGDAIFGGTKRLTSEPIERMRDELGASYKDIGNALIRLSRGEGKDTALSKRIELIIDDNLTHGTRGIDGMELPPLDEYIAAKNIAGKRSNIPITKKDTLATIEAFKNRTIPEKRPRSGFMEVDPKPANAKPRTYPWVGIETTGRLKGSVQTPYQAPKPAQPKINPGDTVVARGTNKPLSVVDSSNPTLLTVKNDKGKEFTIGRKAVNAEQVSQTQTQPAQKNPWEMTKDEFNKMVLNSPSKYTPTETTVDWGNSMSGQGKRVGGKQVMGAMSDAPQGKKIYKNILGNLPEYKEYKQLLSGLSGREKTLYLKAREYGFEPKQAIGFAKQDSIPKISPHKTLIKDAIKEGKPVSKKVLADYPDLVNNKITSGQVDEGIQAMATPATPPPTGGKVDGTVKRGDIIKFLDEKLNVPIRTGRFHQKALGIFKIKPEVIRSRVANDLPTISHEVGHFLDKQLKLSNQSFDSELTALGRQTSRQNYTPDQVRAEGVAEFTRLFLTDENAAKKAAPNYFAEFEQKIKANKDIEDALRTAQKDIYTWYNQPAKARVLGSLSIGEKNSRKTSLDSLYTMTFDEIHPLKGFVEQVGTKNLPIEKDPYKLAWLARGWAGKAETLLKRGPLDSSGKKAGRSLDEILKTVENEIDDFRAYIVAKHSLEVKAQGKETGITDKDALDVINNSPSKYQDTLNDLVKYQDNLLNMLVESGVMKKDAVIAMRELYPNYVPFYRQFDDNPNAVAEWLSKGGYANLNNPVKKMKGSTRDILDPLESIIKNTYLFTNIAEKNRVGRAIVELAEQGDGMGRFVERVEGNRSSKEGVLKVFRNGEPEHYQLDPDLYRATLALDKESTNMVVKILSYPASWLRAGAVLSPDFMTRNPIRDGFSAFINSKYGFTPGLDTMRGVFHAVKKDDLYWQWMNSGGAQSTLVSIDRDYLQKNIREMFKKSTKDKIITVVNPKTYLNMLQSLSEFTELGTRLGEYGKGIKKGANPLDAALASRDVSIDFGRHGAHTKQINRTIAFFNAALQGSEKMVRQFKEKPLQTSVKTALSITAPSVLLYLHNRNDPRYQELPQWQKDMFWIIPTKEHLYRIPKPFEMGILFGTVPERALQWMDSKDPKAFDELGKTVLEGMMPGYLPTALLPIIEAQSNYSFFMKRQIVPQREQNMEPKEQYNAFTTESAKKLGELLNMSPRKIENTIRGYTGGLGMYTIQGGEALADVFGLLERTSRPALTIEQVPGIKALMTTAYDSTQSENELYERLDKLEKQYQTTRNLKQKPPEGFSMGELKRLRKFSDRLADLRKRERDILNNKKMSPQQKRTELTKINKLSTNMARMALKKEKIK